MPEEDVIRKAHQDAKEGKSPSTQAGEFIREEMHHVREGKHGARSPEQAIAIGLSKARRAGVKLPPPKGQSAKVKRQAERDEAKGRSGERRISPRRSRATSHALKREGRGSASHSALSKHALRAANRRGASARRQSAAKALRTKGKRGLAAAARKGARKRSRRAG